MAITDDGLESTAQRFEESGNILVLGFAIPGVIGSTRTVSSAAAQRFSEEGRESWTFHTCNETRFSCDQQGTSSPTESEREILLHIESIVEHWGKNANTNRV